jgi:hypothetical protein
VAIRLWVIIDAAAYTTCRIDVMHLGLQDSAPEVAKRAHELQNPSKLAQSGLRRSTDTGAF